MRHGFSPVLSSHLNRTLRSAFGEGALGADEAVPVLLGLGELAALGVHCGTTTARKARNCSYPRSTRTSRSTPFMGPSTRARVWGSVSRRARCACRRPPGPRRSPLAGSARHRPGPPSIPTGTRRQAISEGHRWPTHLDGHGAPRAAATTEVKGDRGGSSSRMSVMRSGRPALAGGGVVRA